MKRSLQALRRVLRDFAYGINAGNAIRHGLTPPKQPTVQTRQRVVVR